MIIKIVKVFVHQSLDYFFGLWYNMIDVKIGLAAERFGQFGERRQMRHIRKFTRTLYKKNSVRGSLVGADNIGEPVCTGLAICGRALSICFWHGYFCIFDPKRKGTDAHDSVYKRLHV